MIVVVCSVLYDFVVWCEVALCVVRCVLFVVDVVVHGVCLVCVLFVVLRCWYVLRFCCCICVVCRVLLSVVCQVLRVFVRCLFFVVWC